MTNLQIFNYLKSILLLGLLFILLGRIVLNYLGYGMAINHLYFLTAMFFVVSGSFHFILIRLTTIYPKRFVQVFLVLTVAKMLLYLSALLVYIFKMSAGIKIFLFIFLILYISFTIFEVSQLIKYLKNKESERTIN